jgi:hypothetical protein
MQVKAILAFLLTMFSLTAARAQDLPDAPSNNPRTTTPVSSTRSSEPKPVVFNKQAYWSLVAACGTAAIFDAQMSHADLVNHPNHIEAGSWLLGSRPSLGRYYAMFALLDGGTAAISYKLLHSRRKPVRIIGWGLLGGLTVIHAYDDIEMAARSRPQ